MIAFRVNQNNAMVAAGYLAANDEASLKVFAFYLVFFLLFAADVTEVISCFLQGFDVVQIDVGVLPTDGAPA